MSFVRRTETFTVEHTREVPVMGCDECGAEVVVPDMRHIGSEQPPAPQGWLICRTSDVVYDSGFALPRAELNLCPQCVERHGLASLIQRVMVESKAAQA